MEELYPLTAATTLSELAEVNPTSCIA